MTFDWTHWGAGPQDRQPPIDGDKLHVLTLRLCRAAGPTGILGPGLSPRFSIAGVDELGGRMARLVDLAKDLVETGMPALRNGLRFGSRVQVDWDRQPRGKLDVRRTLARARTTVPTEWCSRRTVMELENAVNRLVAYLLHDLATLLGRLRRRTVFEPERAPLTAADRCLTAFLSAHPIARLQVPPTCCLDALEREARRLPADFRRIKPFVAWCREFRQAHVEAISPVGSPEDCLHPGQSLEAAVALALTLAALRRGGGAPASTQATRVPLGSCALELCVDAPRTGARGPTLAIHRKGRKETWIEARNMGVAGTLDLIDLARARSGRSRRVIVITPANVPLPRTANWYQLAETQFLNDPLCWADGFWTYFENVIP